MGSFGRRAGNGAAAPGERGVPPPQGAKNRSEGLETGGVWSTAPRQGCFSGCGPPRGLGRWCPTTQTRGNTLGVQVEMPSSPRRRPSSGVTPAAALKHRRRKAGPLCRRRSFVFRNPGQRCGSHPPAARQRKPRPLIPTGGSLGLRPAVDPPLRSLSLYRSWDGNSSKRRLYK